MTMQNGTKAKHKIYIIGINHPANPLFLVVLRIWEIKSASSISILCKIKPLMKEKATKLHPTIVLYEL